MKDQYIAQRVEDLYLAGFLYNNEKQVKGNARFNFVLSNDAETQQKSESNDKFWMYKMPQGSEKKIRKAEIIYEEGKFVRGFRFLDLNQSVLFEIGDARP